MAVSGSSDFTRTRDQIIHRALRLCGAIKAGETPGAQEITDGAEALNALVKRWQKKQLHVWSVTEGTLFPQAGQSRYGLSLASTDHVTESYVQTALSAAGSEGALSISVGSISGIASGDHIGVIVDDGTIHWTTVNGAPVGAAVALAVALDDSAAVGNPVFAYTSKIVRPLKIVDARRRNISSGNEVSLSPMLARLDYQALPNKSQTGTINQAFYDPQLSTGYLHLWNPPTDVTDLVTFTWHRPIMDFDAAADNPDLPQEWLDPLAFNLAVSLAPEYDVPMERFQQLGIMAASYLEDVSGDDREGESIYFGVDTTG